MLTPACPWCSLASGKPHNERGHHGDNTDEESLQGYLGAFLPAASFPELPYGPGGAQLGPPWSIGELREAGGRQEGSEVSLQ